MELHEVVKKPLMTEKGSRVKEKHNRYVFVVDKKANKIDIKKAIENLFKVSVATVNTMRVKGKKKRLGLKQGRRPDWKKAYVQLKPGQRIEAMEV